MNGAHVLLFVALFAAVGPLSRWACKVPGCNTGGDGPDGGDHQSRVHSRPGHMCNRCRMGGHYERCERATDTASACACSCLSSSPVRVGTRGYTAPPC